MTIHSLSLIDDHHPPLEFASESGCGALVTDNSHLRHSITETHFNVMHEMARAARPAKSFAK